MQAPFDNIVQHLFHQPSLFSVTVDELERMTQQHPYFAAAHFLLLKKMQDTAHPAFNAQLHKTTLYFNNPLWLQYLLQPETATNFTVLEKSPFIPGEVDAAVTVEENKTGDITEPVAESFQAVAHTFAAEEQQMHTATGGENAMPAADAGTPAAGIMDVITAVFRDPDDSLQSASDPEEIKTVQEAHALTQTVHAPWTQPADTFTSAENNIAENIETTVAPEIIAGETTKPPVEAATVVDTENNNPSWQQEDPAADAGMAGTGNADLQTPQMAEDSTPAESNHAVTEMPEPVDETASVEHIEINEPAPEAVQEPEELVPAGVEEPVAEINREEKPLFKTIVATPAAKDDLLFEPYHTVDYFASQGIKLSKMEADSRDKLGRQLKSFTEWLKSMKKLPQVSIDKILSQNEESKVVEDAIHSIENKEVITEAMAEVFEKQGLMDKATEVYQKLSLLNPGKSAYFAAKIDLLKH